MLKHYQHFSRYLQYVPIQRGSSGLTPGYITFVMFSLISPALIGSVFLIVLTAIITLGITALPHSGEVITALALCQEGHVYDSWLELIDYLFGVSVFSVCLSLYGCCRMSFTGHSGFTLGLTEIKTHY